MQILNGRRYRVRELAFSRCGRWLAAGGGYGGVHVWDTANPSAKPLTPVGSARTATLAFRADGRLFFLIRNGAWFLFDPVANELTPLPTQRYAGSIVASPDGQHVIRVGDSGSLWVWNLPADGKPVRQPPVKRPPRSYMGHAAFAPDGSKFVTTNLDYGVHCWERSLELIVRDTANQRILGELTGAAESTSNLLFSARGEYLLVNWAATLACWTLDKPDEQPRKAINPCRKHLVSMAIHPAGPLLTTDNDRLVRVWDVPGLTTDRTIEWNIGKLYAVAVSPDGTRAAVGSSTGNVLVWDWD